MKLIFEYLVLSAVLGVYILLSQGKTHFFLKNVSFLRALKSESDSCLTIEKEILCLFLNSKSVL